MTIGNKIAHFLQYILLVKLCLVIYTNKFIAIYTSAMRRIHSFGKVMSRDWYQQIHCYLHFCHEEESIPKDQLGHHPLYKIRGLLNLIIPKFQSLYVPNQNVCIDESMIPFKGRISFVSVFHQNTLDLVSKCGYLHSQNQDMCMGFFVCW